MATLETYLGLVTSFHRGRPKYAATLSSLLQPFVDLQNQVGELPADFDIDAALGSQLDVVGLWLDRDRTIIVQINPGWFAFDSVEYGFDLGIWKGPYDPETGRANLDDETFRTFLRAKIAADNWDGTIASAMVAYTILFSVSPNSLFFIDDKGDSTIVKCVAGKIPPLLLLAELLADFLPLKPMGVAETFAITSVDGAPLFGFDVDNEYIAGFDKGALGVPLEYFSITS